MSTHASSSAAPTPRPRRRRPLARRRRRSCRSLASSTRARWSHPVMFVVVGRRRCSPPSSPSWTRRVFAGRSRVWLWLTVALRQPRRGGRRGPRQGPGGHACARPAETAARRLRRRTAPRSRCPAPSCSIGDLVVVEAGEIIPGDGDVVEGVASVDESAITGESAPVIRESGGDRSRGHRRHEGALRPDRRARSPRKPGETFIDRMIALVEGAARQKTPNEIALNILLTTLTIIFLLAVGDPAAVGDLLRRAAVAGRAGRPAGLPDPDHDRRPAVRDRHRRHGPPGAAQRARHVGPRGRGRRRRHARCCSTRPAPSPRQPAGRRVRPGGGRRPRPSSPTPPSSPRWPTRPPRAARSSSWPRRRTACASGHRASCARRRRVGPVHRPRPGCRGVDLPDGARSARAPAGSVAAWVAEQGGHVAARPAATPSTAISSDRRHAAGGGRSARAGARPHRWASSTSRTSSSPACASGSTQLRAMGIRTVMITGDNPLTAKAIADGGGRRRLPRRGHPRGQDGPDQGASRRAASSSR